MKTAIYGRVQEIDKFISLILSIPKGFVGGMEIAEKIQYFEI